MLNHQYNYIDDKVHNGQIDELEKKYLSSLKQIYKIDRDIIFILYIISDDVIGFLSYKVFNDSCDIYNVVVKEKYRGKKIGYKLLSGLFNCDITIEVNENNGAVDFYKKYDFKVYDIVDNYYNGQRCLKMIRSGDDKVKGVCKD